jgi:hypothetical protein
MYSFFDGTISARCLCPIYAPIRARAESLDPIWPDLLLLIFKSVDLFGLEIFSRRIEIEKSPFGLLMRLSTTKVWCLVWPLQAPRRAGSGDDYSRPHWVSSSAPRNTSGSQPSLGRDHQTGHQQASGIWQDGLSQSPLLVDIKVFSRRPVALQQGWMIRPWSSLSRDLHWSGNNSPRQLTGWLMQPAVSTRNKADGKYAFGIKYI